MPINPHPSKDDVLRQALAQAEKALRPFESVAAAFMPDDQLPLDSRGVALDIPLGACEQGRTAADLRLCTEERLFVRHFRAARAAASAVREAMKAHAEAQGSEAVLSALQGEGWGDIESAPKDKTRIVGADFSEVRRGKAELKLIWWQPEFSAWISGARQMVMADGYTIDGQATKLHSPEVFHPTHWMAFSLPKAISHD